jgi:hypothetical protein
MTIIRHCAAGIFFLLPISAFAGDFDGSVPLICAPVSAMDCVRGDECLAGLPEDIGAPAFMRLDFVKKTVAGTRVASPMLLLEKTEAQLLLQGREADYGWTIALDSKSGAMTVTLANQEGAFVLFGSCTPQ